MLGQSLKNMVESEGIEEVSYKLSENLKAGRTRPEDYSLRELAESFCGEQWVSRLNPNSLSRYSNVSVHEAGEGVDVSAFSNITGQIFFNKIMEGWKNAVLIGEKITDHFPTRLDGEKMPWLSHVISEGEGIHPGMPYPEANFAERYITTPSTTKYGMIVSVTKEMIFFDLTGQALRAAGETGYKLGYNKEKRILDVVLGNVNNYNLNGTAFNTYIASPSANWVNQQSGTPLVDWTSVEQAYILASKILDPDTGNPLAGIEMKQMLVMPAKLFTARRIATTTEVATTFPAFQASANPPGNTQMWSSGSPLPERFEVLTSPIAYQRLLSPGGVSAGNAGDHWFVGDFKKSFYYMENWPITVIQAPANNLKEFEQDIVLRWKASERGAAAVADPRYVFHMYNS